MTSEALARMCEANAYLVKDGKEELIMEAVDVLRPEEGSIYAQGIFGDQLWVEARFKEVNLVDHRIILVDE